MVVIPVFLSTVADMECLMASSLPVSFTDRRKGFNSALSLPSSSSLNRERMPPTALPGRLISQPHQGLLWDSMYSFSGMDVVSSPSSTVTGIPYSSKAKGLDERMSGKSVMFSASAPSPLPRFTPIIEAIPPRLLPDDSPDSGERVTVTAYSFGMLKATTRATTTAMPQVL